MISDIKTYKIKNIIVLPFIAIGLVVNFIQNGFEGFAFSFLGAVIPIILLFWLYALRMLGAGDIKLLSAIGSIVGTKLILYIIAFSFLSGGIMAMVIISLKKNAKQRLSHLFSYIKSCFLTMSLQPYSDFNNKIPGSVFHFSYAIACGALAIFIMLFYERGSDFFHF